MKLYQKIAIIGGLMLTSYPSCEMMRGIGIAEARDRTPAAVKQESVLEKKTKDQKKTNDPIYNNLAAKIESELTKHPKYANLVIQKSIEVIEKTNTPYEPATYAAMFEIIKEKAEQKPQIAAHLGPNAKMYILEEKVKECKKKLDELYKSGEISKTTKMLIDKAVKEMKNLSKKYLKQDIKG